MSTTVKTQAELDAALAKPGYTEIIIKSPAGVWLDVRGGGDKYIEASGSSTVTAYGSSTVRAYDSSTVTASDSSTVRAYGSSTVRAYGSSTVTASDYIAVHLHSAQATVTGGVVINVTELDRTDPETWAAYHGAELVAKPKKAKELIVYKAVDKDLKSGRGFPYPIGATVTDPNWKPGDFCGNGLHFSPHPWQAREYFTSATRFLKVAVRVKDVSVIDGDTGDVPKLKARAGRVLGEVDIDGRDVR
jgi:hypothetical protein